MCSPSSMAIRPKDRKWFFRLHNFNSNSDYYINPVDGIKTNLAPSWQTATFEGPAVPVETREREIQKVFLLISTECATALLPFRYPSIYARRGQTTHQIGLQSVL